MDSDHTMDAIETIIDYALAARTNPPPARVLKLSKDFIFDTLSLMVVGARAPGCAIVHDQLVAWGGAPEATVLSSGKRLPAPAAALINSMMTHAFDFDDCHETADIHGYAVILPAALAIAERKGGVSGRDFLVAATVGVEIAYRMGEAIEKYRGWHPTATCGVFGAAIASAMISGFDRTTLHNAVGIAYSLASGNWQAILDSSLTKRMQPGLAARAAVEAVTYAAAGITGAKNVLEGPFGFYPLYESGEYDRDALMKDLGSRFEIERSSIKPYPCCRFCHAVPEATLVLAEQHSIVPDQIKHITAKVPQGVKDLVGAPYQPGNIPEVSAQFSIPFCIATTLTHRRLGLREFQRPFVTDPAILDLAGKVDVVVSGDPDRWGVQEVVMELKDGRTISHGISVMKGHPDHPLTKDELAAKSRDALTFANFSPAIADRLTVCLNTIESSKDAAASILACIKG
ncbi:MAG: MmgE/PrpD family protein [Pseudorhodoplanes sp.]